MELQNALKGISHPNRNLFEFKELIGIGGFGKVWKVQYKKTKQILALKELSKKLILDEKLIEQTFKERDILSSLYSPYISNLYCTFQDNDNLYIVLDYLPGKDLRYKMKNTKKKFTEEQIQFIASNVILGLEYIHSNKIIHRDIKPANLVFDDKGYIRISDFGIAVYYNNINVSPAGTPGYLSPESIMNKYKFNYSVDYFSLGIILYEIVTGERPFKSTTVSNLIEEFNDVDINLDYKSLNGNYSESLCDFINKMLVIDPKERIGANNNIEEIKNHNFFRGLNWKHIYHKTIRSPFKNDKKENKNEKICNITLNLNDEPLDKESQDKFLNFTILHKIDFSSPFTYQNDLIRKTKTNPNDNNNSKNNYQKKIIAPLKIANFPKENIKLKRDIFFINSNNEMNDSFGKDIILPLITSNNNSVRKSNLNKNSISQKTVYVSTSFYSEISNDEKKNNINHSNTLFKSKNFNRPLRLINNNKKRRNSLFEKGIEKTFREFHQKKIIMNKNH